MEMLMRVLHRSQVLPYHSLIILDWGLAQGSSMIGFVHPISCRLLFWQVQRLQAQLEHADRQIRSLRNDSRFQSRPSTISSNILCSVEEVSVSLILELVCDCNWRRGFGDVGDCCAYLLWFSWFSTDSSFLSNGLWIQIFSLRLSSQEEWPCRWTICSLKIW